MSTTPTLPNACPVCNRSAAGSTVRSRHRSLDGIIEYRQCPCGEVSIVLEPWEPRRPGRRMQPAA